MEGCRNITKSLELKTDGNINVKSIRNVLIIGNENLTTTGQLTAAQYNMNSDRNLKENIEELTDEDETILKLSPVSFKWKDEFSENKL